jgi:AbrB family looped-hinge helix DNA binding protein
MMDSIVKVDSKGRVLIPSGVRRSMKIQDGSELILMNAKDQKHISMMPLSKEKTVKLSISVTNSECRVSTLLEMLDSLNAGVLVSESRNLVSQGTTEWTFILDTTKMTSEPKFIREKLSALGYVKTVEMSVCSQ